MKRIPYQIKKCPIDEAVFEVRFNSVYPWEAVFGIFYQIIIEIFKDAELIQLPILQLPEAVRQLDPNLSYQPHHRLQKENLGISVGPRVIIFSNRKPYIGWSDWSSFIISVLENLLNSKVFKGIERAGLRYINILKEDLFGFTNIDVRLIGKKLVSESTTVRTEIIDGNIIKILQISNNVAIQSGDERFNASVIDIDCISNLELTNDEFKNQFQNILELSHKKEKELFFRILKDEYIQFLEPIYKEK